MAVSESTQSITVKMLLDNGRTPSGSVATVGVNLGSLNKSTFDNQKAFTIIMALQGMFEKSLYVARKTTNADLEEA